MNNIEQTLSIIKPDAVERNLIDEIKNIFIKNNLKIKESKKIQISKDEAAEFYKVHQSKPFYKDLCAYLASGPIVVMVLEGENVEEKVWRMPLNKNFDKLIDSKNADMQNINYVGGAGSTTAAQFLQRFIINKTPWAHLDIAGMAFSKYGGALNSSGATGFGVRLLNELIEENYE